MAPWESGLLWEPSGYRLGAAGRDHLPGPLSLGWGWLFQGLARPVERLAALAWHLCPCLPALAAAPQSPPVGAVPRGLGKGVLTGQGPGWGAPCVCSVSLSPVF